MSSKSLWLYGGGSCGNLSFRNSMEVLGKNCFVHLSLTHPFTHSNYKGFHTEELDALNLTFSWGKQQCKAPAVVSQQ